MATLVLARTATSTDTDRKVVRVQFGVCFRVPLAVVRVVLVDLPCLSREDLHIETVRRSIGYPKRVVAAREHRLHARRRRALPEVHRIRGPQGTLRRHRDSGSIRKVIIGCLATCRHQDGTTQA